MKKQEAGENKTQEPEKKEEVATPANAETQAQLDKLMKSPTSIDMVTNMTENTQAKTKGKVVGRNDLCPCGSGKKYKNCCGRDK